jgi:hypothetical protein
MNAGRDFTSAYFGNTLMLASVNEQAAITACPDRNDKQRFRLMQRV